MSESIVFVLPALVGGRDILAWSLLGGRTGAGLML